MIVGVNPYFQIIFRSFPCFLGNSCQVWLVNHCYDPVTDREPYEWVSSLCFLGVHGLLALSHPIASFQQDFRACVCFVGLCHYNLVTWSVNPVSSSAGTDTHKYLLSVGPTQPLHLQHSCLPTGNPHILCDPWLSLIQQHKASGSIHKLNISKA